MTRIILPIMGALLALTSSVDAKSKYKYKDRIHLYSFDNTACESAPTLGNMDLVRDACVTFEEPFTTPKTGFGLKPMLDPERAHWYDNSTLKCGLVLFPGANCRGDGAMYLASKHLGKCLQVDYSMAKSARFQCSEGKVVTYVSTIPPLPTVAQQTMQPRNVGGDHEKHAWMLHPWAESFICYRCHTGAGDYSHFDCRETNDESACGPKKFDASGNPFTTTVTGRTRTTSAVMYGDTFTTTDTHISVTTTYPPSTTIVTGTTTMTSITTFVSTLTSSTSAALQNRGSWHRDVVLDNPWTGETMCADAEWDKRGKPKNEVQIHKATRYAGELNRCTNSRISIMPTPLRTSILHSTVTASGYTDVVTTTETSTVTVGTDATPTTTVWVGPASSSAAEARQVEDDSIPHSDL